MDKHERFLRGEMTFFRLAELLELREFPLSAFDELRKAHDRILDKRIQERCKTILRGYRSGSLDKKDLAKTFCLSEQALYELLSGEPPILSESW
jgi:hypothetical protein